jgi:hypothetical protein
MGKKSKTIPESLFRITHPASPVAPIVDTHTHLASTFEAYRHKYPAGDYTTVYDFVRGLYVPAGVTEIVDVWCEAPVRPLWREFADSAVTEEQRRDLWGGLGYWFVMGVHPHEAKLYNDAVEADMSVLPLVSVQQSLIILNLVWKRWPTRAALAGVRWGSITITTTPRGRSSRRSLRASCVVRYG